MAAEWLCSLRKKARKVLRQSAEQTQVGGGGRMNPARTGRCQVGKKELSVLSCPQRTAGASKKKNRRRTKERTKVFMVTRGHRQSKRGKKNVEKKQSTNNLNSHQRKL